MHLDLICWNPKLDPNNHTKTIVIARAVGWVSGLYVDKYFILESPHLSKVLILMLFEDVNF